MIRQLELDLDSAMRQDDGLLAKVRAAVAEDGMTPAEIDAAVKDALLQLGAGARETTPGRPCICEHPQVFVDAVADERRCNLCGRESKR